MAADPDPITWTASLDAGPAGADLAAGTRGTPIDGLVVHIPPGALDAADRITLGFSTRPVAIREGRWSGLVVVLEAGAHRTFQQPVTVEVPLPEWPPEGLVAPYRLDVHGRLHLVQLTGLDPARRRFRFDTFVPGRFTWVYP